MHLAFHAALQGRSDLFKLETGIELNSGLLVQARGGATDGTNNFRLRPPELRQFCFGNPGAG